jgi:hypothetical protein
MPDVVCRISDVGFRVVVWCRVVRCVCVVCRVSCVVVVSDVESRKSMSDVVCRVSDVGSRVRCRVGMLDVRCQM